MKKLLLITFIGLFGCSCSENDSDNVIIDIDHCVPPSEIIEPDFDVIPLETNEQSLISEIYKVKIYDNCFYVEDRAQHSILIFDYNGKYVNKVNSYGRGHGEYVDIMDYDICDGYIYLLSRGMGKILRYDLEGKYIDSSVDLGEDYTNLVVINGDSVLLFANNCGVHNKNYRIINYKSNEVLNEWDDYGKAGGLIMGTYPLNKTTDDGILLSKSYDHTLYKYDKSGYGKLVEFEFAGCDEIPKSPKNYYERSNYIRENRLKLIEYFSQSMFYNNKLYVYYSFLEKINWYGIEADAISTRLSEIDLGTKKSRTIDIGYLTEYDEYPFIGHTLALQDGKLVTQGFCDGILKYRRHLLEQYPQLANIKPDDNPILVVHRIK